MKISLKLEADANVTYQDLAATLLTAVGVLVTVLAVIIALVSMVGLRQLKAAVLKKAELVAEREARRVAAQTSEKFISQAKEGRVEPKDWGNEDSEYGDSEVAP
jgi:hypothetical protein